MSGGPVCFDQVSIHKIKELLFVMIPHDQILPVLQLYSCTLDDLYVVDIDNKGTVNTGENFLGQVTLNFTHSQIRHVFFAGCVNKDVVYGAFNIHDIIKPDLNHPAFDLAFDIKKI